LGRKRQELEHLQRERWEREKENARQQFQERLEYKEELPRESPQQRGHEKLDMIFNNDNTE
jgi:hypothetical protein